ncbi:MAG: DUF3305 domain-containing protein [Gammaproteobacteria bacterium]|nr:MAG: DUF3305 domain-containing protein [Gammaproteobacteria bacterium]
MRPIELTDHAQPQLCDLPISVLVERRPAQQQRWIDHVWDVVGVVAMQAGDDEEGLVFQAEEGVQRFLQGGLSLNLYPDECESYYHNLMSPRPSCYVVAHLDDEVERRPRPFLVTMSFDAAHAYLEGDDEIYAVEIPPEIYRWTEDYVLSYYAPEKRRKRKLLKGTAGAREEG